MRAHIVPIGNSKGIRIPVTLLKLCHIQSEVDIQMKGHSIVISPVNNKPRNGWMEAFRQMHAHGEDRLLVNDSVDMSMENWEW